ncbi:hypothetical protein [Pedobacter cryotolerans]|uniref:Uncharacterized protein n=1 Tax=Pedobacter cryotolerans TaxID=2571270 RepID=A0A4U1CBG3_9SPHI|nr:hypothetical protein [Pedobacter cryotolerans]TKC03396.1 hypothetical protein FA045_02165 [Pedobacter cryotolerans]
MASVTERIDLINSLELIGREKNEKVEMHLQSNFYILLLSCIAFSITFIIVLLAAITEVFGIDFRFNWNKTSLLVLLSINAYDAIGNALYKRIILKHLKFLETSSANNFDLQLNDDLADIASKLHQPLSRNIILGALMIIILIGCITQTFMDNQFIYYKFFIIPTLLFYVLASLNIWNNYKKLKANINEVESSQPSFSTV